MENKKKILIDMDIGDDIDDAFALLPLTHTCSVSHASLATVLRLMIRDTFKYLSKRMIFAPTR